MKVRFTPRATENIAAIADYIRERNPQAAKRVCGAVYEGLQHIVTFPLARILSDQVIPPDRKAR